MNTDVRQDGKAATVKGYDNILVSIWFYIPWYESKCYVTLDH